MMSTAVEDEVTEQQEVIERQIEDELLHQEAVNDQPLTPVQRIKHDHYEEILKLNAQVCSARSLWATAKDRAAALKKEFDALNSELLDLILGGPDMQQKLPLADGEAPGATAPSWSDEWRKVNIDQLDISASTLTKLVENNLCTLGDLDDFWKSNKQLTDLKGIGGATADKVADAFAKYGTEHPELYGQQTPATDETDGPLDNDDEADDEDEEEENWDGDDL